LRLWFSLFGLANLATDGELQAIGRVETLEFTLLKSFTSCGLCCGGNFVARFTVATTGTSTKIDGLFATVKALIQNKVCSMLLTMVLASCITVGQALTANEYLRFLFDVFLFLLFLRKLSPALLESSVVWQLTLRALIECEF
jgi:hypothetical protein